MKNHEPNQTTIKAIEEAEQMINDPNTPSYSTIEELIDHRRINYCIRWITTPCYRGAFYRI